nr:MAG TPA: tail assembly protein [Caudoviricetes sp.]
MLVKIIFHGALKRICPKEYEVNADTPVEAIRGLTNQFRDKLFRKDGKRFICRVAECPDAIGLSSGIRSSELNIYPIFSASGGGNSPPWTMIAVGAIILTAAVFLGPGAFGLAGLGWFGSTTSSIIGGIGLSMMLSGVSLLLAPSTDTSFDNSESSRTFGNNGNTTKIGTPIPIGYGLYKVAGQYLSVNTQAVDRQSGVSSGVVGG